MKFQSLLIVICLIIVSILFCLPSSASTQPKAILVIASSSFKDIELDTTKTVLENNGIDVTIASSSLDISKGMDGEQVKPDMLLEEIELSDFDALVFIGGTGAEEYVSNEDVLDLVRDSNKNNKTIGAICIAPMILAKAGILRSKNATCAPYGLRQLRRNGARIRRASVVVSGNIITANGPLASEEFAKAIVKALKPIESQ